MKLHMMIAGAVLWPVTCRMSVAQLQFAAPDVLPVGSAPSGVAAVDLNGDLKLDLVSANRLTSDVSVLLNAGDGTFLPAVHYPTHAGKGFPSPRALAVVDIDADGDFDVIAVNELLHGIAVLFNDGAGGLSAPELFALFGRPTDIVAVDLDSDGDIDLAVTHYGSILGPVAIVLNNGNNGNQWLGFAPPVRYDVQVGCRAVAAADLDGDSDEDLVVCNRDSATVSILINDGGGVFQVREHIPVGFQPRDVSIQDLDNDGLPDLAVADFGTGEAHLLTNRGGVGAAWVGFAAPISLAGGGQAPHAITSSDLDLDGDQDLAMANVQSRNNIAIFENVGGMQFNVQLLLGGAPSTADIIVADIDGDCALDIVTSNSGRSGSISVLKNLSVVCPCYADCDPNGVLDIFDFLCFQSSFVAGEPYACDCDPDPVCNVFDFLCFQTAFVSGCP